MKMSKLIGFGVAAAAVAFLANHALAAEGQQLVNTLDDAVKMTKTQNFGRGIGGGLAAGLAVVGGGLGIGRIGGSAVEEIGRAHV